MTIQRLYSLPNCTLILEGISDGITTDALYTELRPLLSILVNAECYLATSVQPLSGGREFFESLVTATSAYAQEFLSKVHHPVAHKNGPGLVQLQKVDDNRHRLIVHSQQGVEGGESSAPTPILIDLTTVELFDLVEAVDQFLADSQTLPDLSVPLLPIFDRHAASRQQLVKQAVPATVGVYGLALAAIAFFFVPIPARRPPKTQPQPQHNSSLITPSTSQPLRSYTNPSPPTPNSDLEAVLPAVPEITKTSQLRALNRQLYNQLNQAWETHSSMTQDLVYRVGVTANGAIVGYKFVNAAARSHVDQTPLPKLTTRRTGATEPLAQFRVVFTKNGVLQISPWWGYGLKPQKENTLSRGGRGGRRRSRLH